MNQTSSLVVSMLPHIPDNNQEGCLLKMVAARARLDLSSITTSEGHIVVEAAAAVPPLSRQTSKNDPSPEDIETCVT